MTKSKENNETNEQTNVDRFRLTALSIYKTKDTTSICSKAKIYIE